MTGILPFTLMLLAASANAQQDNPPGDGSGGLSSALERARIQGDRDRLEERFAKAQAACYLKFAVNDCLGDARLIRREAVADLRRQEISLNAAEAKRRGAQQLSRIEEKSSPEAELEAANRRAAALQAQQARQADADEKAAARATAGLAADAHVNDEKDRSEKSGQAQAERAAKADAAALKQKQYADRQKQAQERAEQRRQRLARQSRSTARPLETPASKSP